MYSSPIRFGGIASGLDTEMIVKNLIRVEQMKIDRVRQDRQLIEWQRDSYRNVSNKLRALKDEFFDILKPSSYMLSANQYITYNIESTNSSVVTATANSNAYPGKYTLKVKELASAARVESSEAFSAGEINLNQQLHSIPGIEFDEDNMVSFSINGKNFTFSSDARIRDVMNAINTNSDATIRYSGITNKFSIESKATGSNGKLDIKDNNGGFLSALGIGDKTGDNVVRGRDAQVEFVVEAVVEGEVTTSIVTHTSANNRFTIDGITFDLKSAAPDEAVTLTVTHDVDKAFDNIKAFVDKYNELIDNLNGMLNEERHRDFRPLTDEQKAEMSDREIEQWEEKAKSGMLRNDSTIQNLLTSMRRALVDPVNGVSLSSIGITTGQWYENGKLYINEDKLKNAIANNPEQVMNLFSQNSSISYSPDNTSTQRGIRYNESGLMHRVSDILNDHIRTSRDKNGNKGLLLVRAGIVGDTSETNNSMNKRLSDMDKQIDRMMTLLQSKENRYWQQFTAMEKALQQMQSQGDWLYQQLNAGMMR